jgi:hypothetical protein
LFDTNAGKFYKLLSSITFADGLSKEICHLHNLLANGAPKLGRVPRILSSSQYPHNDPKDYIILILFLRKDIAADDTEEVSSDQL